MAMIGGWKLKYKKKAKPKRPLMADYASRNKRLAEIGYSRYSEYLKSDEWKAIRIAKLRRHKTCIACPKDADQVHHLDYSDPVLLGLMPDLLVSICNSCHEHIEFDGERKRTIHEANKVLEKMAVTNGRSRWVHNVAAAFARLEAMLRKSARSAGKRSRTDRKPPKKRSIRKPHATTAPETIVCDMSRSVGIISLSSH